MRMKVERQAAERRIAKAAASRDRFEKKREWVH